MIYCLSGSLLSLAEEPLLPLLFGFTFPEQMSLKRRLALLTPCKSCPNSVNKSQTAYLVLGVWPSSHLYGSHSDLIILIKHFRDSQRDPFTWNAQPGMFVFSIFGPFSPSRDWRQKDQQPVWNWKHLLRRNSS